MTTIEKAMTPDLTTLAADLKEKAEALQRLTNRTRSGQKDTMKSWLDTRYAFGAAASPSTILSILAERDRDKARIARLVEDAEIRVKAIEWADGEIARLKARIAALEKERDESVLVREYAHRVTAAAARNKALDEAARIVDAKSQQYADEAHDMKIWGNKVAETAARVGSRALKATSAAIRAALKDGTDAETRNADQG